VKHDAPAMNGSQELGARLVVDVLEALDRLLDQGAATDEADVWPECARRRRSSTANSNTAITSWPSASVN